MPILSEIKTGRELGRCKLFNKYQWLACLDCGIERWVGLTGGKPDNLRCVTCANRIKAKYNPYLFHKGEHNGIEFQKGEHRSPNTEFKKGQPSSFPTPKGVHLSPQTEFKKGNHYSPDTEFKELIPGGVSTEVMLLRASSEYIQWRTAVYKRDDYICQRCKVKGGRLESHHIKSFADYPELRFEVDNGITLCKLCHRGGDARCRQVNLE